MASIRRLPSGRFQAAVLLDDGHRTTTTKDTLEDATAWAAQVEDERNRRRAEQRHLDEEASTRIVLGAVRQLLEDGRLSHEQLRELRELLDRPRTPPT
ncbi:hypothetical protein [Geodermatophilus sp. DSM 44513]|uniref:hypothetical protein n=1 Tax=Geodermatophilus sp. DSM 44513 TaxID=1528104 RepID=UPI001273A94B|nr:hypothetical protein [Geodermatophilus sp. DSM 44513]WNV74345.1 hypothetical protein RTG05_15280 [Geodermatophilus sp. DSM 44513]